MCVRATCFNSVCARVCVCSFGTCNSICEGNRKLLEWMVGGGSNVTLDRWVGVLWGLMEGWMEEGQIWGKEEEDEEEAAVSKLSLESNRDRNRWQRISRRAKFSPENGCLYFGALEARGRVCTQTGALQHSNGPCLGLIF